jgi:hypothetical protein
LTQAWPASQQSWGWREKARFRLIAAWVEAYRSKQRQREDFPTRLTRRIPEKET